MSKINFTVFTFTGHFDSTKVKRFEKIDTLDQPNTGAVDYTNSQRFDIPETKNGEIIGIRRDEYRPTAKQLKPYVDLINTTMSLGKKEAKESARTSFIASNQPVTDLVTVFVCGERGIVFSDKKDLVQCAIDTLADCIEGGFEVLEAPEKDVDKVLKKVFDSDNIFEIVGAVKYKGQREDYSANDPELISYPEFEAMTEGLSIKSLVVELKEMEGCIFTVDKDLHPKSVKLPVTAKDGDEYIEEISRLCFNLWAYFSDFVEGAE